MITSQSGINVYTDNFSHFESELFKHQLFNSSNVFMNKDSFNSKIMTDANTYPVDSQVKGCGSPFGENHSICDVAYDFHLHSAEISSHEEISIDSSKEKEAQSENIYKKGARTSESINVHNLDFLSESVNSIAKLKLLKLSKSNDSNLAQSVNQNTKIGRRDIWYKKILRGMKKYYKQQMLSIDPSIGKIKCLKQKYDIIKNCARKICNTDLNNIEYYSKCNMPFYLAALSYPNETKKMLKDLIKKNPEAENKLRKAESSVLTIIDLMYHFSVPKLQKYLNITQLSYLLKQFLDVGLNEMNVDGEEYQLCIDTVKSMMDSKNN